MAEFATKPGRLPCPSSCEPLDPDGAPRSASRPPRTRSAWTTTRSASTRPGIGTSPSRWSHTPTSRSPQPTRPNHARPAAGTATSPPHTGPAHQDISIVPPPANPQPGELIPLTVYEIRRLHAHIHQPDHPPSHRLRWSYWRRRHQARARRCPYQRQQRLIDHQVRLEQPGRGMLDLPEHPRILGWWCQRTSNLWRQTKKLSWRRKNSARSSWLRPVSWVIPSKYSSRGAPGANSMSIEAGSPDSLRKACSPPTGTYR